MSSASLPLVSVCIPTYNDARFLPQTLASVVAQSYPHIEIVVGDDASTDDTGRVVAQFPDARIRYHRNERNLGQFKNVNACIERSSGEVVAVYHSDDVYDATIVEEEVAFLRANPEAGAVFALDRWIDATGRVIGQTRLPAGVPDSACLTMAQVLPVLLRQRNRLLRGPTFMARRTTFEAVGLFEPDTYPIANDLEYWLRILTRFPVGIIRRHLMSYRQDPSQVSSLYNRFRTEEEDFFAVVDRYLADPNVAMHADEKSLIEYAFHRCDDSTARAANLLILSKVDLARSLLARPFPWRTFAGGVSRRKLRVLVLRAALRAGMATRTERPLRKVLLRTEHGLAHVPTMMSGS